MVIDIAVGLSNRPRSHTDVMHYVGSDEPTV